MTTPTDDDLRALGLDADSLDAAWSGVLAEMRAEGANVNAIVARAGHVLTAWRANPFAVEPRR